MRSTTTRLLSLPERRDAHNTCLYADRLPVADFFLNRPEARDAAGTIAIGALNPFMRIWNAEATILQAYMWAGE